MLRKIANFKGFLFLLMVVSVIVPGIAEANNAPTPVGTIPNQTVYLNGSSVTVDVSGYFSDADGDSLTYGLHNSDAQKVTTSVSGATLTISPWRTAGTATLTVTAFDSDNATATQSFTVTVVANSAPTGVGTIPNMTLSGPAYTGTVDLSGYFSDADGHALTYTASSSDTTKATASVSGGTLTVTAAAQGSATITVTAADIGGATGTQSFSVTVTHSNNAPVAVGTIPNQLLHLGGSNITFNARQYFSDPNGDTLRFDALWRSSDAVLDVSGSANWDVTLKPKGAGNATVALTAKDPGGLGATQSFSVKVNKGPEASGTIPDGSIAFGDSGYSLDMNNYFTDANGDAMTYTASSSDTAIGIVNVSASTVTVIAEAGGTVTISVTATDPHNRSATQSYSVVASYSGPITIGTIADKTLSYSGADTPGTTVALDSYFDADDKSTLTYTAVSSDTSKVTASVSGATLTVTPVAAGGSSTITTRATAPDAKYATQTFTVKVKGPPTPNGTIADQTVTIGGSSITINVSSYFVEPDGQSMTYTVTDSFLGGNAQVVLSISGSILTISPGSNPQTGSGTVTVLATDTDGHSGTQRFTLTVRSANRAPTANGTIPNSSKKIGESAYSVDLSGYFTDADGDTLTYSAVSSDTAKATVSLSAATLSVTPVAVGTATITATATDPAGAFATQAFTMTVNPANRTPVASTAIPNQKLERVYAPNNSQADLQMGNYFSDPDGDALSYSVYVPATPIIAAASFQTNKPSGTLTIHPVVADASQSSGTTTITVTATDTDGASVSQSFTVSTDIRPATVGTIASPYSVPRGGTASIVQIPNYFTDADGDTLSYSASSSNTSQMTVNLIGTGGSSPITLTLSGTDHANVTVTLSATDPFGLAASHVFNAIVGSPPTTVGTISDISVRIGRGATDVNVSSYFNEPDGDALSYSASTSSSSIASVFMSGSTVKVTANGGGDATITVTATDPGGSSARQTFTASVPTHFIGEADAIPGLSSEEQALLGKLLTYDTLIFNELYNGSDDAKDWVELRNASDIDIPIDNWRLTIQTGSGAAVIPLPSGTSIPAGEVLLLSNTEMATVETSVLSIIVDTFVLPQSEFALVLRSPTAFGDLAGNYFEGDNPGTAPVFTPDTAWDRVQPIVSGYRAESWKASTYDGGLGTPGFIEAPAEDTAPQVNIKPVAAPVDSKYTFESIEIEGVDKLTLTASSDFEDYAGYTKSADGQKDVAFTLIDGVFTTYDFPGSQNTYFYALGNDGSAAGYYEDSDGLNHGVILENGELRRYEFPDAVQTEIYGISDATGALTGNFIDADGVRRGFSGNLVIEPPGATATFADFVNAEGVIVGSYIDGDGVYQAYVRTPDERFALLPLPKTLDIEYLFMHGINDAGVFVMRLEWGRGPRTMAGPFDAMQPLEFPGAVSTEGYNINQDGSVVGYYNTADGRRYGFIATPITDDRPVVEPASTTYTYESIDVAGVDYLALTASSDFEDYAGYTRSPDGKKTVAFTLIDGVFTTYEFPGAQETRFYALGNNGQAAGHYKDSDGNYHGVILENGELRQYDYRDAVQTFLYGISDATGALTGDFIDADGVQRGFSGDIIIDIPGATATHTDFVNAEGSIVGSYVDAEGTYHAYVRLRHGRFATIDLPTKGQQLEYFFVHGISDARSIVARAKAVGDVPRTYAGQYVLHELQFPGAVSTEGYNINQDGSVVGHYESADGRRHGFIARPADEAESDRFSNVYNVTLAEGLSIVSVPLSPIKPMSAKSLAGLTGATTVITIDEPSQQFVAWTPGAPDDGFAIEGAKGYIVNLLEAREFAFVGAPWSNDTKDVAAAPSIASDSAQKQNAWAFVVSGHLAGRPAVFDGYRVIVRNLRTNGTITAPVRGDYFAAATADLARQSVVHAGDEVELHVIGPDGNVESQNYSFRVTPESLANAVLTVRLDGVGQPKLTQLLQNYPNPFNPETWIPYRLSEAGSVSLSIYDAAGRLIRTLSLGYQPAGFYQSREQAAYWDGRNAFGETVGSGVYFYRLQAGDYSALRRMVILK